MRKKITYKIAVLGVALLIFLFLNSFLPHLFSAEYVSTTVEKSDTEAYLKEDIIESKILPTPEPLKAIYITACVASTPKWREKLVDLVLKTELNAVVIDIKDYTGTVSFPNNFPRSKSQKGCVVNDMKEFIQSLNDSGIYVIGRISVFQDLSYTTLFPELAVKSKATGDIWRDKKGIGFIDVGALPYWDYILELSRESVLIGFDELNYDYIRYPSDGNMQDAYYSWMKPEHTKAQMLEDFFKFLNKNVSELNVKTSADLFGMTTTVQNDLGIGQILEKALPYFDYIAPMVYPSHYPPNWNGFVNPAQHPYDVIKIAMSSGLRREQNFKQSIGVATSTPSKLRPWIQDFNLGAIYDEKKVRDQIRAVYDVGLSSWMLWDSGNTYTESALNIDRQIAEIQNQ